MIESDDEEKGSRLILPPVSRPKQSVASIQQVMNILSRKKSQFQQELQRQQPTDQEYNLKYARCETEINAFDSTMHGRECANEQYLARGTIIEHSFYRKALKKKNRLITATINSTIDQSRATANSILLTKHETRQIQENRYKSLQTKEKEQLPLINGEKSVMKVASSQKESQIKKNHARINQFAIPISSFKEDAITRPKMKTEAQKESNHTKDNSEASNEKMHIQRFKEYITDLKRGSKTNERLEKTIKSLQLFNPFFRKIQRVIGVCLLRMGRIRHKTENTILYRMDDLQTHFFIILSGEVKITGRFGMHKICEAGETLLQEILDVASPRQKVHIPVALQKAKVTEDSWILQIERDEFKKLEKELNKFGFRQGLRQMKTLIKRNSIVKNWLRNKFKTLQR